MANKARPLSPHLQVYKLKFTMVLSGLHRITGMVMGLGTVLLVWWLVALATGQDYFDFFMGLAAHPIGRLVLFGYTFSLIYHALNGVRHLFWDIGHGFEKQDAVRSGMAVVALTVLFTVAAWVFGYMQLGAL